MQKKKFQDLVDKFLENRLTKEEEELLLSIYYRYQSLDLNWDDNLMGQQDVVHEKLYLKISENIDAVENAEIRGSNHRFVSFIRYVAAILLLSSIIIGRYIISDKKKSNHVVHNEQMRIMPGGNKAFLTLSDGKQILLDSLESGRIAVDGRTGIDKTADGKLVYNAERSSYRSGSLRFNTITTPRGGQYLIVLPDGSTVILNAASSIRFPTSFPKGERRVEITGEAYFEVVHKSSQPFRVIASGQVVEDLGTKFNINAYKDELFTRTTLSEGRIRITNQSGFADLMPGQQAIVENGRLDKKIMVTHPDIYGVFAWKDGRFTFSDEDITAIMRQLGRWYDIDPVYARNLPKIGFSGTVSRNKSITEVLKVLEITEAVHFKIQGRRVFVMP